jgi:hypothetical protein
MQRSRDRNKVEANCGILEETEGILGFAAIIAKMGSLRLKESGSVYTNGINDKPGKTLDRLAPEQGIDECESFRPRLRLSPGKDERKDIEIISASIRRPGLTPEQDQPRRQNQLSNLLQQG